MTTQTYKASEDFLTANGFEVQRGMPLTGVIFKGENKKAIVIRMGDNNYETTIYNN